MPLILTEEQQMLKDAARSFLSERAPLSHLREIRDTGQPEGYSPELWTEMAEMGWAAILVPEEHGGLGYGYTGLGLVLEECGRTLTPSPLLSTALTAATALNLGGSEQQKERFLPAIATGEQRMALAIDEQSQHDPADIATTAISDGDSHRINGSKRAVIDGGEADTLIVSARTEQGLDLFLVPASASGVTIEPYRALDIQVLSRLQLENVEVPAGNRLTGGTELLERVLDASRIGMATELLGLAQEVFERTLEYLKERKQFGVPIGSFQALQHRAAFLFGEIDSCRSLVLHALHILDEGDSGWAEAASMTKAKLGETAHLAAAEAIQMHGGIGMTDDVDIGFFLKRCRFLEMMYGDNHYHLDRFARGRGY